MQLTIHCFSRLQYCYNGEVCVGWRRDLRAGLVLALALGLDGRVLERSLARNRLMEGEDKMIQPVCLPRQKCLTR